MAVAADLHRDFLIPERQSRPTTGAKHPMNCVYSFLYRNYSISEEENQVVGKITYHKKTKPNLVCPTSLFGEAGKYTPKRDDMLAIGEMICQVCDLDKKKPHPHRMRFFLVEHA